MKLSILPPLLALLAASLLAAVPQTIVYQGRLTAPAGDPVPDGAYLIQLRIYDVAAGGTPLWDNGYRTVPVINGLFTYQLGDSTALPPTLFEDTARWLSTKVGADPEISPRIRLTGFAYAFHALRADTAQSAATVADNAITSAKIAPESVTAADLAAGSVGSSELQSSAVASSHVLDGAIQEIDLAFAPLSKSDLETHAGVPAAHHTKTTSATELTSGTLSDALLSANIPRENAANTFTSANTFDDEVIIGDSTFRANAIGSNIGDPDAPSGDYLLRLSRDYNSTSAKYGLYSYVRNLGTGNLYGIRSTVLAPVVGSGGSTYGSYSECEGDGPYRCAVFGSVRARTSTLPTGSSFGLHGEAFDGATAYGVYAYAASATTNWAGYFQGSVNVTGTLSKGGGAFRIDHPLDPENRYLQHSFVESPDMMNIYNGNVVLGDDGSAIVTLPEYFDALNRDFRYQLTPIGSPGPNLYIAEEISGGAFTIAGGTPGMKVSWMVTGIRQDRWAEANRVEVEVEKKPDEKGYYLHYQEWNQPVERSIDREVLLEAEKARTASRGDNLE